MSIKNIVFPVTGLADAAPALLYIDTDDTIATVTTAGYLDQAKPLYGNIFNAKQMAVVYTTDQGGVMLKVVISADGANASLESSAEAGLITLPTVTNQIVYATNTTGGLAASGANIVNTGTFVNTGAVTGTTTITAGTGLIATTGNVTATAGNVVAGSSGAAGTLISFPATAANGSLIISALNAGGAFNTTVRNSVMGQSSVISIPDPGAATANFLLDTGAANILSEQQFLGLNDVITFGTGTWAAARIGQGNYVAEHTPADETSIIAVDITPAIRVAASKGFRLNSFDYIYGISANALDAHTLTLNQVSYANGVAVVSDPIAVTGVLATATAANPYVTNVAVDTPAFLVTTDSKYVIEITVDNSATSEFDYYGIMLRFSQTIG